MMPGLSPDARVAKSVPSASGVSYVWRSDGCAKTVIGKSVDGEIFCLVASHPWLSTSFDKASEIMRMGCPVSHASMSSSACE